MHLLRSWLSVGTLIGLILVAWSESRAQPTVYVVNYPLQYFAERIGGTEIKVVFPAPVDEDPAFWRPNVSAIVGFQGADLILINGATYAKWLKTASLPKSKVVNTSKGFEADFISVEDAAVHTHGPTGDHSHAGTAFTTWLDFRQAAQQALAVLEALSRLLPDQRSVFEQRYAELEKDLLLLDDRLESAVAGRVSQPLVASHPVYQYLARRYGLNIRSVLWEPEVMPEEAGWQELADILSSHEAAWMMWEGDPLPASVERLQSLGVRSLVFDPCGNRPSEGDFLDVMQRNVDQLGQAFQ
ncbi:MAG: zinc ABC transporter substrate-binding protein [Candidatus Tectomicrobia bacterium]|nr:zinc ABC transporter substrate-binding protein [Candidatus Tectomicrobia bacterium]